MANQRLLSNIDHLRDLAFKLRAEIIRQSDAGTTYYLGAAYEIESCISLLEEALSDLKEHRGVE
jgi:hypothetical protein